ncbi:MAG: MBL fold metallo-hydrolase, partial [Gemmataceae bacterium]|nr:MBL fold metallo-hydrolase [Gemmataceae bacterium]
MRFTVLASGSAGNASVVQAGGSAVLIDAGLQPRLLEERLGMVGLAGAPLSCAVLTHTHGDHWNDAALSWLHERGAGLVCHPSHQPSLERSAGFRRMLEAGSVRFYASGEAVELAPGLKGRPHPVRHDSGATFAFRLEGPGDLFGSAAALGLATDLGVWDPSLAEALADCDVLAVEFNHDVGMQQASKRPQFLIDRVLGEYGHLSNEQAAAFLKAVLEFGEGRLQHVVQLHLSRECNRPALARRAARAVLDELGCEARLHTATQHEPLRPI